MCQASQHVYTRKTAVIAYKVVRKRHSNEGFVSEYKLHQREPLGEKTKGTILTYCIGRTTIAPARSLGIFLYRKRPVNRLHDANILKVLIPAGTKLRRSLSRGQFTSYRVKVLGVVKLDRK